MTLIKLLSLLIFIMFFSNLTYSQDELYDDPSAFILVEETDSIDIWLNNLIEADVYRKRGYLNPEFDNFHWHSGIVYTINGDTLNGEIKRQKILNNGTVVKIKFRKDSISNIFSFRADSLIGFEVLGRTYKTKQTKQFPLACIEMIEKGDINLYWAYYDISFPRLIKSIGFYIDSGQNENSTIIGPVSKSKGKFFKTFRPFIEDNKTIFNKVKTGKYRYDHLPEIVHIYNELQQRERSKQTYSGKNEP